MSKKRKIWVGAALAVLVLALAGVAIASSREKGKEVRTEAVGRRDLISVVTASGIIQPKRKVDISADISGRVIELAVEEGQLVQKGALILRIDPTAYQAMVRRAEAAVAQAQANASQARANLLKAQSDARRAEALSRGENLISQADLDQARTAEQVARAQLEAATFGVQQAQASLSEAREALRKTTIVAPMSGRVTRLNIEEGETAVVGTMNNPGSLLLTVADLGSMEASVKVDETDVPSISFGDSATLRIDAFPNQIFTGKVTRIANSSIAGRGTTAGAASQAGAQGQAVDFEVIITLDNPPAELRPDLSATAEIVTDTRRGALAVPIIAVTVRDSAGKKFQAESEDTKAPQPAGAKASTPDEAAEMEGVFVINQGKAEWVPVSVGIAGERYFEVTRGLKGGETVIAGPYSVVRDLEDGEAVRTPAQEPASTEKTLKAKEEG